MRRPFGRCGVTSPSLRTTPESEQGVNVAHDAVSIRTGGYVLSTAMSKRLKYALRWLLLLAGLGALAFLVRQAGPQRVWHTLVSAGAWLPVIILLEIAWVSMDVGSLRIIYARHFG